MAGQCPERYNHLYSHSTSHPIKSHNTQPSGYNQPRVQFSNTFQLHSLQYAFSVFYHFGIDDTEPHPHSGTDCNSCCLKLL